MKDFFISYTKTDHDWAVWIAWQIESEGYTTILQAWDFIPGHNFILEMHQATKETDRTITVLSPKYFESMMAQPEWAAAFVKDPTGKENRLVPVRVRKCKPEGLLTAISYIDLVGLGEVDAKRILINEIKENRRKPINPPQYPGSSSAQPSP